MRNERNVLAAVAGHPFITTMVASFQNHDSLYMLVRIQLRWADLANGGGSALGSRDADGRCDWCCAGAAF